MSTVILVLIITLYILHVYRKSINRFCKSHKRLDGKTVLVTGGTCGMGLQTAIDFAKRGAKVIIASPFSEEGTNAKKEIEAETSNKNVIFKLLDLSSLQSVRDFAADIMKTENRLDVLVNNAGIGILGDFATADGMNFIMQNQWEGTQTTLYGALEEEAGSVSGQFFKNCRLTRARALAYDDEKSLELWQDSIKLVKLSDDELQSLLN